MALSQSGEKERAIECLDRAIALEPTSFTGMLQAGVRALLRGDVEEGLQAVRDVEVAKSHDTDSEHRYWIARVYGALGDSLSCARLLSGAVTGGFFNYPYMERDPYLDPVRDDPAIQAALAAAKEKHEAFKKKHFS